MSIESFVTHDGKSPEIDFNKIQDIIYWCKKWEISPYQLIQAYQSLHSNDVKEIEKYLRGRGFAL